MRTSKNTKLSRSIIKKINKKFNEKIPLDHEIQILQRSKYFKDALAWECRSKQGAKYIFSYSSVLTLTELNKTNTKDWETLSHDYTFEIMTNDYSFLKEK